MRFRCLLSGQVHMRIQSSYHESYQALSSRRWHMYCREYWPVSTGMKETFRPFFSVLQNRLKFLSPLYIAKKKEKKVVCSTGYDLRGDDRCTMHVKTCAPFTICHPPLYKVEYKWAHHKLKCLFSRLKRKHCAFGEKKKKNKLKDACLCNFLAHETHFIFNARREGLLWLMWRTDVFKQMTPSPATGTLLILKNYVRLQLCVYSK